MSFSAGNAMNNASGCEAKSTWRWRHSTGHKSSSISSSSSSNGRGEGDVRCRPTTATSGATQRRHFTANNDNYDDDDEWLLLHVTDRTVYSASYMTERRPLMLVLRLGRAGFRGWQLRWRRLTVAAHVVLCGAVRAAHAPAKHWRHCTAGLNAHASISIHQSIYQQIGREYSESTPPSQNLCTYFSLCIFMTRNQIALGPSYWPPYFESSAAGPTVCLELTPDQFKRSWLHQVHVLAVTEDILFQPVIN